MESSTCRRLSENLGSKLPIKKPTSEVNRIKPRKQTAPYLNIDLDKNKILEHADAMRRRRSAAPKPKTPKRTGPLIMRPDGTVDLDATIEAREQTA